VRQFFNMKNCFSCLVLLLGVINSSGRDKHKGHRQPELEQNDKISGAVVMLVDQWKVQRGCPCTFNKSMDALQKYWHPNNPYPIIIADKKPWSKKNFEEIRRKWPDLHILFVDVSKEWNTPPINSTFEDKDNPLSGILPLPLSLSLSLSLFFSHTFSLSRTLTLSLSLSFSLSLSLSLSRSLLLSHTLTL
jgi:hypothetical protein